MRAGFLTRWMSLPIALRRLATYVAAVAFVLAVPAEAHASVVSDLADTVTATTDAVGATVTQPTSGATQAVATAVPAAAPVASAVDRAGSGVVAMTQRVTEELAQRAHDGASGVAEPVREAVDDVPVPEREPASAPERHAAPVATAAATATPAPNAARRNDARASRVAPSRPRRAPKHRRADGGHRIHASQPGRAATAVVRSAPVQVPGTSTHHRSRPAADPASGADRTDPSNGDVASASAASSGAAAAGAAGWALLLALVAAAAPAGLRSLGQAPLGAQSAIVASLLDRPG